VTDPERTLLDLATVVSRRELTAAFDAARARRLLREPHLVTLIARFPTRHGTRALRTLLETPGFSRSKAERLLRGLIGRANLPRPLRNAKIAGHEVDFHWPDAASLSRSTATPFTPTAKPSRTTADATPTCSRPAIR